MSTTTKTLFERAYDDLVKSIEAIKTRPIDPITVVIYSQRAMNAAGRDDNQQALVHVTMGEWLLDRREFEKALLRLNDAQNLAIDQATRCRVLVALAEVHKHRGDHDAAHATCQLGLAELSRLPPSSELKLKVRAKRLMDELSTNSPQPSAA